MVNRLREVRFYKKVNQYQLALLAGIHQSRISLIENGYTNPKADEKERLAKVLHVSPEEIWGSEDPGLPASH